MAKSKAPKVPGDKLALRIPPTADPDVLEWLNGQAKTSTAIWEAIEGYIKMLEIMNRPNRT